MSFPDLWLELFGPSQVCPRLFCPSLKLVPSLVELWEVVSSQVTSQVPSSPKDTAVVFNVYKENRQERTTCLTILLANLRNWFKKYDSELYLYNN